MAAFPVRRASNDWDSYFRVTDCPSRESFTSQPAAAIASRRRSYSAQFFALRASALWSRSA